MQTRELFSMIDGYAPVRNIIGIGDPNVHFIDGRWTMFLGGFQTSFKNNLFCARLAPDEKLNTTTKWVIQLQPGSSHRAQPLIPQPEKSEWDAYGLHEPCYVEGRDYKGEPLRRIYYSGRATAKVHDSGSMFSIGFIEYSQGAWKRHGPPVVQGSGHNSSALGPKVIHDEGLWKMWYRATPQEPVKGTYPETSIYYTESADGIHWNTPTVFFDNTYEVSHAYVHCVNNGFVMLTSTSPNLFNETPYPPQKLWLRRSDAATSNPQDWSEPEEVLDASECEAWCRNGFFGASIANDEDGDYHIYFSGVHSPLNWLNLSAHRLMKGKLPPFPAPYFLTIGKKAFSP